MSFQPYLLFTYGSLMRGGEFHSILANASFEGRAVLQGPYRIENLEYPCLMIANGEENRIQGELFEVRDSETQSDLDEIEDAPEIYNLREVKVLQGGQEKSAYAYFFVAKQM